MIFPSGAASYEVTHLISFSNVKCMFTLYANGLKLFSPIEFLTISLTKYFLKVRFFTALGGVFTSNSGKCSHSQRKYTSLHLQFHFKASSVMMIFNKCFLDPTPNCSSPTLLWLKETTKALSV